MGTKAWWTGGRASRWCLGHTFSRRLGGLLASEGCPSRHRQFLFSPHCAWKMGRVLGLIVQGGEMPTLASPLLVFTSPRASSRTTRAIYGHQGSPDPAYPSQGSTFSELVLNPFSPRLTDPSLPVGSTGGPRYCSEVSHRSQWRLNCTHCSLPPEPMLGTSALSRCLPRPLLSYDLLC